MRQKLSQRHTVSVIVCAVEDLKNFSNFAAGFGAQDVTVNARPDGLADFPATYARELSVSAIADRHVHAMRMVANSSSLWETGRRGCRGWFLRASALIEEG